MDKSAPTVVITGAGGGLGEAVVARFVAGGWQVFAADLNPPAASDGVIPLVMDVTDTASVDAAFATVAEQVPEGIDCVVTMAGLLGIGPMAEMPDDKLQRIVDVNIMGTHRTIRAGFDLLHKKRGRAVLISSETGWQPAMPFNGAYALTKHAIEAYGDALRREWASIGMSVVILQPGPFRTNMTRDIGAEFKAATKAGSPFEKMGAKMGPIAAREHNKARPPVELAEALFEAATTDKPKSRYAVHNERSRAVVSRLPVGVVDGLLRRFL